MEQQHLTGSFEEAVVMLGLQGEHHGHPAELLTAWLVDEPPTLARFAARIPVVSEKGRLVRKPRGAAGATLWIAYGTLVVDEGVIGVGSLSLAPLRMRAVAPAAPARCKRAASEELHPARIEPDPRAHVSAGLLRLLSVEKMLNEAVARLRHGETLLRTAALRGTVPEMGERQAAAYEELKAAKPRVTSRPSDRELASIAFRYLALVTFGARHPLPQLAAEFGLSREQARDRVHRARERGFLEKVAPGERGKAIARPGPALLALGWNPPEPPEEKP